MYRTGIGAQPHRAFRLRDAFPVRLFHHVVQARLLWSFFLGIFIDMFSNTPGVAASSATFIGLLQPYLLNLFSPRDSSDDMMPTMKSLGVARYVYYTIICVFIFNLLFFTVEMFSFFNWLQWALNICGSTVLTVVLILVIENVRKR